jgi:hypothetical protein
VRAPNPPMRPQWNISPTIKQTRISQNLLQTKGLIKTMTSDSFKSDFYTNT